MTPERIARLWAAVCVGNPERAEVACWMTDLDCGDADEGVLVAAVRAPPGVGAVAYGLTDDEALAALWELVVLHARMQRDEINAATGGAL